MKLTLIMIMVVSVLVIGYFLLKTYREGHRLSNTVRGVLYLTLAMLFFNMIATITQTKMVYLIAYSCYFIACDWMFYFLLYFSIEFVGNDFDKYLRRKFVLLLLSIDTIILLVNPFTRFLFDASKVYLMENDVFYQLVLMPQFFIHYAIVLVMIILCVFSLLKKVFRAAIFYRRKYAVIVLCILIIAFLNALSLSSPFDISVIGYVMEAICIFYCTFVYTPQRLLPKTLLHVARGMEIGLYVLDADGREVYANHYARMLLGTDQPLVDKSEMTLEEWCRIQYTESQEEFVKELIFYQGEEERTLKIQLQRMMDSNKQLQGGYFVLQDRTEEINKMKVEHYLATHNRLTDMCNKEYFCEQAEAFIKRHDDMEMLMVCTDIKDFKIVNDILGTQMGDLVLKNTSRMIKEKFPEAVAHGYLGNDIFAILIAKEDFDEERFVFKEQEGFFEGSDKEITYPILNYVGVFEIRDRELPVSVMCDRARMAISMIKGNYHQRVAYYDDVLRDDVLHEQELIADLEAALTEGQMKMYLQPQISAEGKMTGAEALVYWVHPEKGIISPGRFVPVFERNGLISDVDRYMWEQACVQLRKWKMEGRTDLYISVNISAKDLYYMNIYQVFLSLIARYQINPKNLKLEITESAIAMDFDRHLELIGKLRSIGFVVEMDDFGSGYSSLNMLKDINVDVLKIDMAFLRKGNDEEKSKKILKMIISLSKQLGMQVVTEGVEKEEQVQFLTEMGCDVFQGYYFNKPLDVETFEKIYL